MVLTALPWWLRLKDAGLRLLCAPEAHHLTHVGQPRGWVRLRDIGLLSEGRGRKGSQMYNAATVASRSSGWTVTAGSPLGARQMARHHRRMFSSGAPK